MAKILQKKLEAKGATVYMSRATDRDFEELEFSS
ncbi:N-acetylmuramoyl-L-alanine amidase [Lysinibacillus mangiferihumi]|uniref:N-acetylmuramoyl-L-alanine amidase n=1 Tax=Lysinibacillus mangiferihumi TaxID=1130819 RepID=A0A4U2YUQ0_9BACI|nr:N-acetylmuramoyl-L-alanine amidase [Lysinibacillus mangiferihumi]